MLIHQAPAFEGECPVIIGARWVDEPTWHDKGYWKSLSVFVCPLSPDKWAPLPVDVRGAAPVEFPESEKQYPLLLTESDLHLVEFALDGLESEGQGVTPSLLRNQVEKLLARSREES